ncbi:MmpS family transport accessory protein [Mycobacterium malmoense]|uniref:MmpS family transport accessory protein n=1 Tax=Mycobacterium malmoense TaxID=1780 RepID=UPI0032658D3C
MAETLVPTSDFVGKLRLARRAPSSKEPGLPVSHLRGMFGSHQQSSAADVAAVSEPVIHKQVTYEIYGSPTTPASINYLDAPRSYTPLKTRRCRSAGRLPRTSGLAPIRSRP